MNRGTKKTRHSSRIVIVLFAMAALLLASCGSSGSTSAADNKGTSKGGSSADWQLVESSTPAMLTELKTAMSKKEPIVVTLWRPHWAYAAYDIKDLKDPKGAMGKGEEIWAVSNKKWAADNPGIAKAVGNFKLSTEQLASLENEVFNKHKGDEAAGVKAWLAADGNQATADAWASGLNGSGKTVDIGLIPWDEDVAVTALWKNLLEAKGFTVKTTEVDAGVLFQGMADGDINMFFDTWLPETHKDYWAKYGPKLQKLSQWYEGKALLTIAVPKYMTDINSLDDLKANGDKFDHKIIGIEPGAGLTRVTKTKMMPAYGLTK